MEIYTTLDKSESGILKIQNDAAFCYYFPARKQMHIHIQGADDSSKIQYYLADPLENFRTNLNACSFVGYNKDTDYTKQKWAYYDRDSGFTERCVIVVNMDSILSTVHNVHNEFVIYMSDYKNIKTLRISQPDNLPLSKSAYNIIKSKMGAVDPREFIYMSLDERKAVKVLGIPGLYAIIQIDHIFKLNYVNGDVNMFINICGCTQHYDIGKGLVDNDGNNIKKLFFDKLIEIL